MARAKAKPGPAFNTDQRAQLELIRDRIATSLGIETGDFDYSPFNQRGGLGEAHGKARCFCRSNSADTVCRIWRQGNLEKIVKDVQ